MRHREDQLLYKQRKIEVLSVWFSFINQTLSSNAWHIARLLSCVPDAMLHASSYHLYSLEVISTELINLC